MSNTLNPKGTQFRVPLHGLTVIIDTDFAHHTDEIYAIVTKPDAVIKTIYDCYLFYRFAEGIDMNYSKVVTKDGYVIETELNGIDRNDVRLNIMRDVIPHVIYKSDKLITDYNTLHKYR